MSAELLQTPNCCVPHATSCLIDRFGANRLPGGTAKVIACLPFKALNEIIENEELAEALQLDKEQTELKKKTFEKNRLSKNLQRSSCKVSIEYVKNSVKNMYVILGRPGISDAVIVSQCLNTSMVFLEQILMLPYGGAIYGQNFGSPQFQGRFVATYYVLGFGVGASLLSSVLYKLHAVGFTKRHHKFFVFLCVSGMFCGLSLVVFIIIATSEVQITDTTQYALLKEPNVENAACLLFPRTVIIYPRVEDPRLAYPGSIAFAMFTLWVFFVMWLVLHESNRAKKTTASQKTRDMLCYMEIVFYLQFAEMVLTTAIPAGLAMLSLSKVWPTENLVIASFTIMLSLHSPLNCLIIIFATRTYRNRILNWIFPPQNEKSSRPSTMIQLLTTNAEKTMAKL
ncbi:unnamed protein product, partial [Mesorhabditis belari]|uniref:Uncharacterized protein n=1 Tax=Mesorhabditis belari TaxID=2138241 RepID=A0AAF3EC79_9BILA